jgi:hypothetical protein
MKEMKLVRELDAEIVEKALTEREILEEYVQDVAQRGDSATKETVNTILYDWENRSVGDIVKELFNAGFSVETVTNKFGRILKKATVMRFRQRIGAGIREFRRRKAMGWTTVDNS